MFLQNRQFSDTDTLLEVLFDLELGTPSPELAACYTRAESDLAGNAEFQNALLSLPDEEDRLEEVDEAKRDLVAEMLQQKFEGFKVADRKLWGLPAGGTPVLLSAIDLV